MSTGADGKRDHSLKRPPGHQVKKHRWTVKFPDEVDQVCTLHVGVQFYGGSQEARTTAEQSIEQLLNGGSYRPAVIETFRLSAGNDVSGSKLWVAHWTQPAEFAAKLKQMNLLRIWQDLGESRRQVGLWCEQFIVPLQRLQTSYFRLDYKPGLAALPGVTHPAHDYTEYWGAGRDRLSASSHDLFPLPSQHSVPRTKPVGFGQRIFGTNYDNMCHIRSGQRWEECDAEEREAYEGDLQKVLMRGMKYLWDNPEETGSIGLRMGQKVIAAEEHPIRETAVMGFHRNWADLEQWSSRHPSHLEIFSGSVKHGRRFGDDRKFMTWQEVAILKQGEASFEYINCDPRTGVVQWVELKFQGLASLERSKI
jgi:Haem-containing dehydratase